MVQTLGKLIAEKGTPWDWHTLTMEISTDSTGECVWVNSASLTPSV